MLWTQQKNPHLIKLDHYLEYFIKYQLLKDCAAEVQ